jgi:hypothetical protein
MPGGAQYLSLYGSKRIESATPRTCQATSEGTFVSAIPSHLVICREGPIKLQVLKSRYGTFTELLGQANCTPLSHPVAMCTTTLPSHCQDSTIRVPCASFAAVTDLGSVLPGQMCYTAICSCSQHCFGAEAARHWMVCSNCAPYLSTAPESAIRDPPVQFKTHATLVLGLLAGVVHAVCSCKL